MADEDPVVDTRNQAMIEDDAILRDALCHGTVDEPAGARCGRESEFVVDGVPVCAGHLARAVRAQLDGGEDGSVLVTSSRSWRGR